MALSLPMKFIFSWKWIVTSHLQELRKIGKPGRYMVHNFGKIHPSTHVTDHSFILRFINTDLHNTFVTFRIDAADIVFVYNVAKGRIVDAYAPKFTAVKEVGQLFVEVENTGQLESEYSIILSKCLGRQSTPSKVVSILPGCIANVSFSLQSYKTKGESSLCEGMPRTVSKSITPAHLNVQFSCLTNPSIFWELRK